MKTGRRLKLWTMICHALIIIGFGHGIFPFVVIEILWFPYYSKESIAPSFYSSFENHLPLIGLFTLLGQCIIISSLFIRRTGIKSMLSIAGLVLLWCSLGWYMMYAREDYVHIATITCLPFVICTIITFAANPIQRFYRRAFHK